MCACVGVQMAERRRASAGPRIRGATVAWGGWVVEWWSGWPLTTPQLAMTTLLLAGDAMELSPRAPGTAIADLNSSLQAGCSGSQRVTYAPQNVQHLGLPRRWTVTADRFSATMSAFAPLPSCTMR
jgi:hypothetical protein